ncbi:hypothetical protein CFN78_19055 [Amycolatopsis antarctica]|uniref:Probable membrane transporter protein n=1 Tax=Amycolatopsis antarctica TaxID=1854586 RepID=A0A263CZT9_9PSEU|nr:TSUP family transporter [Amycolatopsis antarctica]OZM71621.1 hypothetical protein CFN78_19055 [Amycolatopsis antarctica]
MTLTLLVPLACLLLLAGALQRLSGIGYALVASPGLLAAVGPDEAVRLVAVTSIASCAVGIATTWRESRPFEACALVPFALLAIVPAGYFAAAVGDGVATLLCGLIVLPALAMALRPPRRMERVPRWLGAVVAGSFSGAMNAVAGLGGPMAASYGMSRRWGAALVPNMQLFLLLSAFGVVVVRGWPDQVGNGDLLVLSLSAAVGVAAGGGLSARVTSRTAGAVTVAVAITGAGVAIVRGVAAIV